MRTGRLTLLGVPLWILLVAALGCVPGGGSSGSHVGSTVKEQPRAVYFAPRSGAVLTGSDLKAHQAVAVVHDLRDLEAVATTRVAIWIDKEVASAVDLAWLRRRSSERYPVVLVGYANDVYAFRDTLPLSGMSGPGPIDWSKNRPRSGFTVWMQWDAGALSTRGGYLRAFGETPTVEAVQAVTDVLLGK